MMKIYITENWLRDRFGLGDGTEIHLPANAILTPAARDLIDMRNVSVRYLDEKGQVFVEDHENEADKGAEPKLKHVNVLTSDDTRHAAECVLCHQVLSKKPDALTNLNSTTMISKNDPRLKFRSEVDSAIALAIWIQTELEGDWPETFCHWLSDLRSALGNLMKAEVTGDTMPPIAMGDLNEEAIHKMSHNPLTLIGHDHIVPEMRYGKRVAKLNLLRAKVRELETTAAQVFIGRDFVVERPDIMKGLNRLSSAIYVLMIMTIVTEQNGKMVEIKV